MSPTPKLRFGIAAVAVSCLIAGYAVAQQQTTEREGAAIDRPPAKSPAAGQIDRAQTERREFTAGFRGEQAGANNPDVQRFLAGCLLSKNQAEVEIGKFAQQQAQTPEVKEFAQKMVQDHGKLVQQLQQLAGAQTDTGARERKSTSLDAAGQDVAGQPATTTRAAGGNAAVDQLLAIEKQITERSTQMAREELQQKQGVEFDKCYIAAQIGGHMHMLAALEVIQQQGPQQLQQLAQQAQPDVQQHLEHAKQIMKQLEGEGATGAPRAARQPTDRQR